MRELVFIPLERKDIFARGEILEMPSVEIVISEAERTDAVIRLLEEYTL